MRRLFTVILSLSTLACLLAAVCGYAQQPEQSDQSGQATTPSASAAVVSETDQPSREQLRRLFEVMRIHPQMDAMLKMMPQAIQSQLQSEEQSLESSLPPESKPTEAQKEALNKVTARFMNQALKIYPAEEMEDDLVSIYKRHLTREDVEGIIAFYKSPTGQHLLDNQPVMMKEMMPITMKKMQTRAKTLSDSYVKELKEAMMNAAGPSGK
jgi:hypothetical protein